MMHNAPGAESKHIVVLGGAGRASLVGLHSPLFSLFPKRLVD